MESKSEALCVTRSPIFENLEGCAETHKPSEAAHHKKWKEFLANLQNNIYPARTWRTIKSLSGAPISTKFAETLLHKGQTTTTTKGKINDFIIEYAAVNRLRFYKEERKGIR